MRADSARTIVLMPRLTPRAVLFVAFVLIIGAGLLATRLNPAPATSGLAPAAPAFSDAAIKVAMVENLNALPDSTAAIPRDANGVPDIAVRDGVLIVATSAPETAAVLCRTVAAVTNDPATGKPLGVIGVTIISGGHSVADCRP